MRRRESDQGESISRIDGFPQVKLETIKKIAQEELNAAISVKTCRLAAWIIDLITIIQVEPGMFSEDIEIDDLSYRPKKVRK